MDTQRLQYLFTQHDSGLITATEKTELYTWLSDYQNREEALHFFETTIQSTALDNNLNTRNWQSIIDHILSSDEQPATVRTMWSWKRIAVAASVIGIIFLAYFISTREKVVHGPSSIVQTDVPAPDKNRAQIKLSDGSIVYLDSAANGQLATQSNVVVTKTADGKIIYTTPSAVATPTAVEYNTLSNPRGSKVQPLTLSDGTKVWLNAESSITYPTAFIGNERKVTITGEAYFEVAKDAKKKFIVDANGTSTEVLGTHFNVNAYDDESEIKVTLLEGSVQVSAKTQRSSFSAVKIIPGQQAVFNPANPLIQKIMVQTDEVMAWKENKFIFNSASIQAIAKQLEKWYDVDITIQPGFNNHFTGIINRSVNASEVFSMLQRTGTMNVKINGRKIEISK